MLNFQNYLKSKLSDSEFAQDFKEDLQLARLAVDVSRLREQWDLTQAELASKAKITQQQLSKVENAHSCNLSTFLKVCDALGADVRIVPRSDGDQFGQAKIRGEAKSSNLEDYRHSNATEIFQLLHRDCLDAAELLWNNGYYTSATKLFLSAIDTLAFVEFGDVPKNFHRWLERYADLGSLHASSDELWELRNSLLHMTNNFSRKVIVGKARTIIYHIGALPDSYVRENDETLLLDLERFIVICLNAVSKYCHEISLTAEKTDHFFSAYSLVLSDSRYAHL